MDEELSLLIDVLDDEPMVVISPEEKTGFIGKMDGIVKNEQLHVLLMDLFLDEESKANSGLTAEALAIAKGIGHQQADGPSIAHIKIGVSKYCSLFSWPARKH